MSEESNKKPSHIAYVVTGEGEDKKYWKEIGAAWPNKDGKGYNIEFFALPLGRVVLRANEAKE